MQQSITEETFESLQARVKDRLGEALKRKIIAVDELMAILYLLGQSKTVDELTMFLEIFSADFPVLARIHEGQREHAKGGMESRIKKAVSRILAIDPMLATEITKAAMKPGMTWDELKSEYPELEWGE
jgi:hypothetical protein